MNSSSNASTERRKPMPKPFTTIVPPSFKAACGNLPVCRQSGSATRSSSPASSGPTPRDGFLRLSRSGGERLYDPRSHSQRGGGDAR